MEKQTTLNSKESSAKKNICSNFISYVNGKSICKLIKK